MNEQSDNFKIETGIILEKVHYSGTMKICIPTLTPLLSTSSVYSKTEQLKPKSNLINNSLPISKVTIRNYFELKLPRHLLSSISTDEYGYISKGTKLIIAFIGGDLVNPKIIGVY